MLDMEKHFVVAGYGVHSGRVLLVHHKKLGAWLPVGGHIEKNETPDEALEREFREESGLEIEIADNRDRKGDGVEMLCTPHHVQLEYITDKEDHYHIDLVYFCKISDGSPRLEDAHKEIRWFSKDDLMKENLQENVRHFAATAIDVISKRD